MELFGHHRGLISSFPWNMVVWRVDALSDCQIDSHPAQAATTASITLTRWGSSGHFTTAVSSIGVLFRLAWSKTDGSDCNLVPVYY